MMEDNELVDLNNNELDMIGLHSTRAELDFTVELKRLNMENRPMTPGAPLRRSDKITNFPSRINFDEMGLADGSAIIDFNGNISHLREVTLVPKILDPISLNLPPKIHPADIESSAMTPSILRATSISKSNILSQPSLPPTHFLVPTRRFKPRMPPTEISSAPSTRGGDPKPSTLTGASLRTTSISKSNIMGQPSLPPTHFQVPSRRTKPRMPPPPTQMSSVPSNFHEEPKCGLDTIPSESDKSGGDGGGHFIQSSEGSSGLQILDTHTIGDASSGKVRKAGHAHHTSDKSKKKSPKSKAKTKAKDAPDSSDDDETTVAGGANTAKSNVAESEGATGAGNSDDPTKTETSDALKRTSASSTSKSSKSGSSSSRSSKSSNQTSNGEYQCQDGEGKRGAIMFKVPGRLTHKTTIKVSHFPQNGNGLFPSAGGAGNAECVVEDVGTQQQQNCPPCAQSGQNPQSAAAMQQQQQQMMAYQQYYGGGMYCNPYCYYPYGGGRC